MKNVITLLNYRVYVSFTSGTESYEFPFEIVAASPELAQVKATNFVLEMFENSVNVTTEVLS